MRNYNFEKIVFFCNLEITMVDFRLEFCYCFELNPYFDGPYGLRAVTVHYDKGLYF